MTKFHTTFTIAKKELKSYFNSPVAYVVVIVFLLLWEYLFFRNAFLVGETSLRSLFFLLPWLSLLLVPAVTMGSIAQEKNDETLELVLTHPVKDRQFVFGKFLGSLVFLIVPILFIFPLAISFNSFGNLDWGATIGQFLASLFFIATLTSLGIFISSLFSNQISSFLVTAVASFLLIIAGFEYVTASLPVFLGVFFERISVLSHFQSMARGVVDIRDLWYFATACAVFLSLAYWQLVRRRGGRTHGASKKVKSGIILLIIVIIAGNIFGSSIPGRIDLTESQAYSLATGTKNLLGKLPEPVTVTLYSSGTLPSQFQPVLRDTKDVLRDYQTFGKGKVNVELKNTDKQEVAQEAGANGIQQVQFNVVGTGELQVKQGFLGLTVGYKGEHETVPFIQSTRDLEYQLSSFISKLTTTDKKTITFLSGHDEKTLWSDYQLFNKEASKQFSFDSLTFDEKKPEIATTTDVLVIAGPGQAIPNSHQKAIQNHLDNGGAALFLADGVAINPQFMSATSTDPSLDGLLKQYGITLEHSLAYDLRSNETIGFSNGILQYFLPYPFWIRVVPAFPSTPVTSGIQSVVMPWASPLAINEEIIKDKNIQVERILATTGTAGRQNAPFSIAPDTKFSNQNLGSLTVALALSGLNSTEGKTPRVIVIGDSELLMDQFIQNHPENLAFGMSALSWLVQEESLAGIRIKQDIKRNLVFENDTQISLVKFGNLALALLLPLLYGAFRLFRRRGLKKFGYQSRS